jgi:mRNA interferase YafQ
VILRQTSQFKKDLKLQVKRGKRISFLEEVVVLLASNTPLPVKYRDHALQGVWKGHRDCHVQPDWILIYRLSPEELVLERTGSHSDLFQ